MRIGVLTSEYPLPSHTFIRREVEALRTRELEIDMFSVRRPSAAQRLSARDEAACNETWYILPARPFALVLSHVSCLVRRPIRYGRTLALALRHRVPGVRGFVYGCVYFGEAIYLARELERRSIGRVHNHFANAAAIVGLLATRYLNLPWGLTLHGTSDLDYPSGILLAGKIQSAEFVACVSHFGRAQAMRKVDPVHWGKLFVSRCGIELDEIPEWRPQDRLRVRVLCVSRLAPEKGLVGLLRAFSMVLANGCDAELRIVGEGPERARLEATVAELALTQRVTLPGHASEQACIEEMAQADIFALSSFMEGLPVVLMEAMAVSIPVVAPCVAGVPELVQHDASGLLYCVSDWAGLAQQLERLIRDSVLRRQLGVSGQARVRQEFDVRRAVQPLAERLQAWSISSDTGR